MQIWQKQTDEYVKKVSNIIINNEQNHKNNKKKKSYKTFL